MAEWRVKPKPFCCMYTSTPCLKDEEKEITLICVSLDHWWLSNKIGTLTKAPYVWKIQKQIVLSFRNALCFCPQSLLNCFCSGYKCEVLNTCSFILPFFVRNLLYLSYCVLGDLKKFKNKIRHWTYPDELTMFWAMIWYVWKMTMNKVIRIKKSRDDYLELLRLLRLLKNLECSASHLLRLCKVPGLQDLKVLSWHCIRSK